MFNKKTADELIEMERDMRKMERDHADHIEATVKDYEGRLADLRQDHAHEIRDLNKDIELKKKDFDFQIAHQESETVKSKEAEIVRLTRELAVAKEKIAMLDKIVDLNSDVIDVKKLVEQLISKLPEVKISSLSVTAPSEAKK